jgi:hypothetical protein
MTTRIENSGILDNFEVENENYNEISDYDPKFIIPYEII